jgi:hypothetical protein
MLVIVFATTILLLGASIRRKKIIIDEKSIIFANRFRKREFNFGEIESIRIRKSPAKVVKNDARFVSIKIKNRKKAILVRTASFSDDKILLDYFLQIKQKIQNI